MENKTRMQYSNFHKMIDGIKKQEYAELKAAIEAHGGAYCWEINGDNECPIIAVNLDGFAPNPEDVCISKVMVVDDRLVIEGVDKELGFFVKFDPNDVFAGHLSCIIDYLPATKNVTSVAQTFTSNVLFGKAAVRAYNNGEWDEFVESYEGYGHSIRTFDTDAERQAYYAGIIDNDGWEDYAILDEDELLDDENLEKS